MGAFYPTPSHPGYVAGRWYNPNFGSSAAAGTAVGTNLVRLLPFMLQQPIIVSDLGVLISTLAAGGNVRAAIYAANQTTKVPTTVLAETGNMVTDAAVAISADITGANVSLAPGLYWQAVFADNATVVLKSQAVASVIATYLYGSTTLATGTGSTATDNRYSLSFASTFGAFPDLTGQSLTELATTSYGVIFVKAA